MLLEFRLFFSFHSPLIILLNSIISNISSLIFKSWDFVCSEKYEEIMETIDPNLNPIDKLIYMNKELFLMIENTVSVTILSQLFSTQLITRGERHLLEPDRTYYKLLRQITIEGQKLGYFKENLSINDITKAYAMFERGLMYDWCLCNGNYSLLQYSEQVFPLFLKGLCK